MLTRTILTCSQTITYSWTINVSDSGNVKFQLVTMPMHKWHLCCTEFYRYGLGVTESKIHAAVLHCAFMSAAFILLLMWWVVMNWYNFAQSGRWYDRHNGQTGSLLICSSGLEFFGTLSHTAITQHDSFVNCKQLIA